MLEIEFSYFQKNQKELAEKYSGKFIVIKGEAVIGAYETEREAYEKTIKDHELGTFLIQQCLIGSTAYIQTFHSRAIF